MNKKLELIFTVYKQQDDNKNTKHYIKMEDKNTNEIINNFNIEEDDYENIDKLSNYILSKVNEINELSIEIQKSEKKDEIPNDIYVDVAKEIKNIYCDEFKEIVEDIQSFNDVLKSICKN